MKILSTYLILIATTSLYGKEQQPYRIALRAPDQSVWGVAVKKLSSEIQTKTQSKVQFRFLTAGVTGTDDEALENVYRNKLAGALLTGPTLSKIQSDFRTLERPFTQNASKDLGWNQWKQNIPKLAKDLEKQNIMLLSTFRVGKIYCAFKKKLETKAKIAEETFWVWSGDQDFKQGLTALNYKYVESTPDQVDKLVDEGKITAACAPIESILSMKWQVKLPYTMKSPAALAVGAFIFSKQQWNDIPKLDRETISKLIDKSLKVAEAAQDKLDAKKLSDAKQLGLHLQDF